MTPDRARATFDALLQMAALTAKCRPGFRVAPVVADLMRELYRDGFTISASGNAQPAASTMEHVEQWVTPGMAGAAVGLSDRRVRQLGAEGRVRTRRMDGRTVLVDLADLHRHLQRGVA